MVKQHIHALSSLRFPCAACPDYAAFCCIVRTDIAKRAIGVSRITGTPPSLTGTEDWEGDAQGGSCCWSTWNGKSWGMIAVGSTPFVVIMILLVVLLFLIPDLALWLPRQMMTGPR